MRPAREALPPCVQGLGKGTGSSGLTNLSQDWGDVGEQVAAASEQACQFSIADVFGVVAAMPGRAVACRVEDSGALPPIIQSAPFSRGPSLCGSVSTPMAVATAFSVARSRNWLAWLSSIMRNAESMSPPLTARITARLAG